MLAAVARLAEQHQAPLQVSVECYMGCGFEPVSAGRESRLTRSGLPSGAGVDGTQMVGDGAMFDLVITYACKRFSNLVLMVKRDVPTVRTHPSWI